MGTTGMVASTPPAANEMGPYKLVIFFLGGDSEVAG